MKKIAIILSVLLLFIFSIPTFGQTKIAYYTTNPINVVTRMKAQTIIFFNVEIEFAGVGNLNFFKVDKDSKLDKLIITPLQTGACTNLIVVTKDSLKYTFRLIESDKQEFNDIVEVRPIIDIGVEEYISAMNEYESVDGSLRSFLKVYTVDDKAYPFADLKIQVKKVMQVDNLEKTVVWLKVTNTTGTAKPTNLYLPIGSIKVKERELSEVAVENNKEQLKPNDSLNMFLILNGKYLDNAITFIFTVNGKEQSYLVADIPYQKQEFKIFNIENKSYNNIVLNRSL